MRKWLLLLVFPYCYLTFTVLFLDTSVIRIQGNAHWFSSFLKTRSIYYLVWKGISRWSQVWRLAQSFSTLAVVDAQQRSADPCPTPTFWNGGSLGSEKWVGKFLRSRLWISGWMVNTTLYHISNRLWVLRDSRINYWSLSFSSGDALFPV